MLVCCEFPAAAFRTLFSALKSSIFLGLCLCACIDFVHAQSTESVSMTGQALVHQKQDSIEGCGMRFTTRPDVEAPDARAFEVIANVFRSGRAGVKLAYPGAPVQVRRAGATRSIESGWLAAPYAERAEPVAGGFLPSDGGSAVVYSASFAAVMAVLRAQAANVAITVALRSGGESAERVYAGRVAMEADEALRLSQCLRDMLPRVGEGGR